MTRPLDISEQFLGFYIPIIILLLAFGLSGGDGGIFILNTALLFTLYFFIVLLSKFGIPEPRIGIIPGLISLSSIFFDYDSRTLVFWTGLYSFCILQLIFSIIREGNDDPTPGTPGHLPEWAAKSNQSN